MNIQDYFNATVAGIEAKLSLEPNLPNPRKKYALNVARLGQRLYDPEQTIAWCGVSVPFDLLNAMGITSCFVEFIGAMLASTGMSGPFLETAEQSGFPADACGYHRAVIGATRASLMPKPDVLVASSCPCSASVATIEYLAKHFAKPLFALHIPYERTERNRDFLATQLEEMVLFVAKITGHALDSGALNEAVRLTNAIREVILDIYRLASQTPSPLKTSDLANFGIVMGLFAGTIEGLCMAESFRDEFISRRKAMSGDEGGLRLLWVQSRIQFKHNLFDLFENKYKATIVIDELNDIPWEPIDQNDPYRGFAERILTIPFNGSIEIRIKRLLELADIYKIDGVINPCHFGCRQGTGARGLIEDSFKKRDLPVLNLEVDCIDQRNFSEGQLKTRLEAFLELLANRH